MDKHEFNFGSPDVPQDLSAAKKIKQREAVEARPSETGILRVEKGESGKTVFASEFIRKGNKIFDFSGPLIPRSDLTENIVSPQDDRFIQVGKDLFIGPSGGVDDLVNHSCDPNAAVLIENNTASLFSIKDIKKGDEITFDYSLQMNNESWTMECHCGSKNCRGIIGEYKYLPQSVKDYYLTLGFVPEYNRGL